METNEKLKMALLQETEKELLKMIDQLEMIKEGDLQTLEQSVLRACLSLGRTMMEQILNHTEEEVERPSRREGACGHQQRLVGIRPKQLHNLMGKVTIRRAYYQCMVEEEEPSATCSHGQAPWDLVWGQIAGRTSPGVQKLLGKLVSRLTLSEAVDTFTDVLPLPVSERQALNLIQPLGEALSEQEEEQVQTLFEQAANKEMQQRSTARSLAHPSGACILRPMESRPASAGEAWPWKKRKLSAKPMSIARSKWERFLKASPVGNVRNWCQASFSMSPDPLRMWHDGCM